MVQLITASFDGKAIIPDQPLALSQGQRLRVQIETLNEEPHPLAKIASQATDMGVTDLAERHSQYARART